MGHVCFGANVQSPRSKIFGPIGRHRVGGGSGPRDGTRCFTERRPTNIRSGHFRGRTGPVGRDSDGRARLPLHCPLTPALSRKGRGGKVPGNGTGHVALPSADRQISGPDTFGNGRDRWDGTRTDECRTSSWPASPPAEFPPHGVGSKRGAGRDTTFHRAQTGKYPVRTLSGTKRDRSTGPLPDTDWPVGRGVGTL